MNADAIFNEKTKPDLTPMIDVVFLLLVFFMVTTTLIKEETDLGIQLPTDSKAKTSDELPTGTPSISFLMVVSILTVHRSPARQRRSPCTA